MRVLNKYLSLGLKLTKIHRGITFDESDFMKSYIKKNTRMRRETKSDSEKDFFKLMNNSVYGKTMENVRNRVDIKLMTDAKNVNKLYKKPNFKKDTHFDENLIAVHMEKTIVTLDKPIYLGVSILDISKTLMYRFHYNYMKPKYGNKANLLFTDTDSLCYEIETENFYKDISGDVEKWFDTSNYDEDHPSGIYTKVNKKEVGFMKDECGGIGLRSKLYAYQMSEGKETKKCKGVKENVIKNNITVADYEKCLDTKQPQFRSMNTFRSRGHNIGSETINKTVLSANDDKRIILEDGIRTLAIGYRGEKWAGEAKRLDGRTVGEGGGVGRGAK